MWIKFVETIDDKEVRENTREFLKNFEKGKLNNLKSDGKYDIPLPEELSKIPLGLKTELKKSLHNIAAGRNLSTAVTVSETRKPVEMNPDNNITATGEFYVPWNKCKISGSSTYRYLVSFIEHYWIKF